MVAFLSVAFAADCATHPDADVVANEAEAVASALQAADPDRFTDGMSRLQRAVECLGDVPPEEVLVQYRLYRGVQRFGAGDPDAAAGEFLAARALDPALQIPVYPDDHEINGVMRRHDPVRAERQRLPLPRRGTLYVDGFPTRERFVDAPALVQLVDDTGVRTWSLGVGEEAEYAHRHPWRTAGLATTGGLAAVGAGLLAASAGPRGRFESGDAQSVADLTRWRAQTNTLAGSGLAALTGAGLAGALTVVGWDR